MPAMAIDVDALEAEVSVAEQMLARARVIVALEQALDTMNALGNAPEATKDLERAIKDALRHFSAQCVGLGSYFATGKLLS